MSIPKLLADTMACTAHTVVEPSWSLGKPGSYHQPPDLDWVLPMILTARAMVLRIFFMSRSGFVLQKSDRPYASDRASVANPWPWIQRLRSSLVSSNLPSFCLLRRYCKPRSSALPRSPVKGSSAAARYARQAKLVIGMCKILPQEPSLAWFLVSQSSPFSRAAGSAVFRSFSFSLPCCSPKESPARAQHARIKTIPTSVKTFIVVSLLNLFACIFGQFYGAGKRNTTTKIGGSDWHTEFSTQFEWFRGTDILCPSASLRIFLRQAY